jgi:exosortase
VRSTSANSEFSAVGQSSIGRHCTYLLAGFAAFCLLPSIFLLRIVWTFLTSVLFDPTYAYIPLIPFVSIYLIYIWRHSIFQQLSHSWKLGSAFCVAGTASLVLAGIGTPGLSDLNRNCLLMLGFVLFWLGGFLLFFGRQSFRIALFPLLFLLFAVPIPDPPLSSLLYFLQRESSTCAAWMFQLMGVPFLRNGFDFALPGFTIRVAEECSGIRSTLALIICTALAGRLFLQRFSSRLILCLFVVPISIVKNGFRIAFLSTMAIYVSPSFLKGPLHYHGGMAFFVIALVPMFILFRLLRNRENKVAAAASCGGSSEAQRSPGRSAKS